MLDLQKASILKRISAGIFDFIILVTLAIGLMWGTSSALNYKSYAVRLKERQEFYSEKYGVDFSVTAKEYEKLTEDEVKKYNDAVAALLSDDESQYVYSMIVNLTMVILTFGILFSYLVLEFAIPMFFKNGQTLGKKIFGIGVMRVDGVKLSPLQLFIRTVLGKFTVETMIPVLLVVMIYFGTMGIVATAVIAVIGIVQLGLLFATKNRSQIHDLISGTVAIDIASQMIFSTPEELLEYKKRIHEEAAQRAEYR
jgi:uncharacterized RDD family membrane protein YckC